MTREARFNLIFLIVLLALSAPGMIILTTKALRGTGGLNASPPTAKVATVYLNPVGASGKTIRLATPKVVSFVDGMAQKHLDRPAQRLGGAGGRPSPLIGHDFRLEALGRGKDGWYVLIWQHVDGPDASNITGTLGGQTIEAQVVEVVDVPTEVRRELQKGPPLTTVEGFAGYAAPPRRVAVVRVTGGETGVLSLSWDRDEVRRSDAIDLSALPGGDDADIPTTEPAALP